MCEHLICFSLVPQPHSDPSLGSSPIPFGIAAVGTKIFALLYTKKCILDTNLSKKMSGAHLAVLSPQMRRRRRRRRRFRFALCFGSTTTGVVAWDSPVPVSRIVILNPWDRFNAYQKGATVVCWRYPLQRSLQRSTFHGFFPRIHPKKFLPDHLAFRWDTDKSIMPWHPDQRVQLIDTHSIFFFQCASNNYGVAVNAVRDELNLNGLVKKPKLVGPRVLLHCKSLCHQGL